MLKDNEDDLAVLVAALLPTTLSVPSLDVYISSDDESSISSDESLMSRYKLALSNLDMFLFALSSMS